MSRLEMTLEEIRAFVDEGEIVGSPSFCCRSVASLDKAGADQLSFVKSESYFEKAHRSGAGALLVPSTIKGLGKHQLVVGDPYRVFVLLLQKIADQRRHQPAGIHPSAVVHASAEIGDGVIVGEGAIVRRDARIGDRTLLYPNVVVGERSVVGVDCVLDPGVVLMEDVTLGDRVTIHAGTVIGADGFGFLQHEGRHVKIPQVGGVVIGDDVEIGALTTIDRATVDETVIGRGTKIGDLCHIAHNCQIGEDVMLLPTVAIAGSATVGDRALFAGRSGVSDNLTVGEGAVLGGTAVAWKDVAPGAVLWGNPARDKGLELRIQSALRRLPQMQRDLRKVMKQLDL